MDASTAEPTTRQLASCVAGALGPLLAELRAMVERHADPHEVLRGVSRVQRLADALRSYGADAGLQSAAIEVLPELCSFADLLRHTFDRRFAVDVHVASACPAVRADPDGLADALMRLAVNARDAMPEGGNLVLRARADGPATVVVELVDQGVGMAEAVCRQAPKPFFSTKQADPGAGLGLAAVDGFARESGGSFSLSSRPGAGTVATLRLPPA